MAGLLDGVKLTQVATRLARNVVSLRESRDLFDDLSSDPDERAIATEAELNVKPPEYKITPAVVHRPFGEADWFSAIGFPFENWSESRFSAGNYGVWYGAYSIEGTCYETAYHWYHGLLADAGFQKPGVSMERKVYWVHCDASLVDLRPEITTWPALIHGSDYSVTQRVGAQIHYDGHPGLITQSARCDDNVAALFTPKVLTAPRIACFLTYLVTAEGISVSRQQDDEWLVIEEPLRSTS